MIEQKMEEISRKFKKVIIVLKGFDCNRISKTNKYFDFELMNLDLLDEKLISEKMVELVILNRNFSEDYKWMTIEEYQLFKQFSNIVQTPVVVLNNNIFDKQYPYYNTISNIDLIYKQIYFNEEEELAKENLNIFSKISKYYPQIDYSKESGNYYVTYPEFEFDVTEIGLYPTNEIDLNNRISFSDTFTRVEVSENELTFLDFQMKILNDGKKINNKNVTFVISNKNKIFPFNYLNRISILNNFYNINYSFEFTSLKKQIISKENEYLQLLDEIYGYSNFRNIDFYENIENDKSTISISQSQIIDDIINQSENAINGESFKDIYITAPTGAGKSVMFQIPAIYLAKKYSEDKPLTIVISPLIGLMNDQVQSMKNKGVSSSETINGNTPPYQKELIINGVQEQKIDVLYLSPETLQARGDIKMLIGDRKIGVVIIDEAHIVTTWGKSFRADYWYLGIYLTKLRKEYKFPIVTFTATAIYGGKEDMYADTRNSLNMISPISYFGVVKRNDIFLNVRSSQQALELEGRDYRKTKHLLTLQHLRRSYSKRQKTLVYFPTVRLLEEFYSYLVQNDNNLSKVTGKYYGPLRKEEKDSVLYEFKNGDLLFVLATKAFGMGIDIPDIVHVYHYAPTGNVVDYIQEIGRAARDNSKVQFGFGHIDFLPRDLNEVRRLHGMSAIKKLQIIEVMKKILAVYKEKGYNRNLIVSPEDFKYIFVQNKSDEDNLDNKVKTVLLMIEKDFSSPSKLGYSPFVARPRSLFGNDSIFVTKTLEKELLSSPLSKYFTKVCDIFSSNFDSVYKVNLGKIWERYYRNMTYPNFKYSINTNEECLKLKHHYIFSKLIYTTGIELTFINNINYETVISKYTQVLKSFERFVAMKKISEKHFTIKELGVHFKEELKIADVFASRAFAQTIINSAFEYSKIKDTKFIVEKTNNSEIEQRYQISQDPDMYSKFIMKELRSCISPDENFKNEDGKIITYYYRSGLNKFDSVLSSLGIGEALGLFSYSIKGGENPQIYIRINSIFPLEKAIKNGDFYQNSILRDVQIKHQLSVEMLKFLFQKNQPEKNSELRIKN